jgi:hypothetical protein
VSDGLQRQRTELAWLRTTLSAWAVAALMVRLDFPVGVLAVTGPVAVTVIASAQRRRLANGDAVRALTRRWALLVTAACALIALTGVLLR